MKHTVIVLFILCTLYYCSVLSRDDECGQPGQPIGGYFRPNKTSYTISDTVFYDCHQGSILIGPHQRRCLPSGVWSGSETVCVPQLSRIYSVTSSSQSFLLDRNRATCNIANSSQISFLLTPVVLRAVMIVSPEESLTVGVEIKTSQSRNPLKSKIGSWGYTTVPCSEDFCINVSFISLTFEREAHLCELIFYGWAGSAQCGFPPIPLKGKANGDFKKQQYSCEGGFDLIGDEYAFCTEFGMWSGEQRRCDKLKVEDECPAEKQIITNSTFTHVDQEPIITWPILLGLVLSSLTTVMFIITIIWTWNLPMPPVNENKPQFSPCEIMEPTIPAPIFVPPPRTDNEPFYTELL